MKEVANLLWAILYVTIAGISSATIVIGVLWWGGWLLKFAAGLSK